MADQHFEPYVCLADVTHDAVLVAWGGFLFGLGANGDDQRLLVDDQQLDRAARQRHETIGARSRPYGLAVVDVVDDDARVVARAETDDANHVWVEGLEADTRYGYRISVDGRPWATGQLHDWVVGGGNGTSRLERSARTYDNHFRTHPHPQEPAPLTFAVIGDYGWGVRTDDDNGRRQRRVARALEHAVDTRGVRVLVTTGDNIYLGAQRTPEATGREDDDWFFTYYQPYRHVINRVPVYPTVGNHDSSDEEASDDRAQLSDNFFLDQRFGARVAAGRASLDPGLFYRFGFGRDVEFVAIDTSKASSLEETRYFNHPKHVRFLEEALPDRGGRAERAPRWSILFCHHPPYCAGPHHGNMDSLAERLLPLARRAGVRLMLSGHEHNFQHSVVDGIHFVVSGAAAKLRAGTPQQFQQAHTRSWASEGHFLLVDVDEDELRVQPVRGCGEHGLDVLAARTPDGRQAPLPVIVKHGSHG